MWKQPFYSLLNIVALTLSTSISLLIVFIIYNQFSYDAYNTYKDRIYRINTLVKTNMGNKETYATSPYATSRLIDSNIFSSWVSLVPIKARMAQFNREHITASGAFTSAVYFSMFQLPIESGSTYAPLSDPRNIVLSKSMALKLFRKVDCIGQIIELENLGNFNVSAVYNDLDFKNHIRNDFLLSDEAIPFLSAQGKLDESLGDMNNYTASYLYVLANKSYDEKEIQHVLATMSKSAMLSFIPQKQVKAISFVQQVLTDISPSRTLLLENSKAIPINLIVLLFLIVLALSLLTAFNYSSITVALGLTRSKEIGVRKIIGANRRQVFLQFILESVMVTFISCCLGLLLFPIIADFGLFQNLMKGTKIDTGLVLVLFLFAILLGIIAGLLPAAILSRYNALNMLYNLWNQRMLKGISFRKIMIVCQFSISFGLIFFVIVLVGQSRYMAQSDYGFSYKNMASIPVKDSREHAIIIDKLEKMPEVLGVSSISTNLGYMPTEEFDARRYHESEKFDLSSYYIDHQALNELGLQLIAGVNFSSDSASNANQVLINEMGYKQLKFNNAEEAIAQEFFLNDSLKCRILGVIKDFHFQNFKQTIRPMIFRYDPTKLRFVNARIHPANMGKFRHWLDSKFLQNKLGHSIDYFFWEEGYRDLQRHSNDVVTILFFALSFLLISCLGLIGIVAYATQQRVKEITLRKIMGANLFQVFLVLTKEYLILLLLSVFIGVPLGYLMSQQFLVEFAYRISINVSIISMTLVSISFIGLGVLASVTFKACLLKPIIYLNR